jgi:OmcA/MtrC family decaheme c-type cytochrome
VWQVAVGYTGRRGSTSSSATAGKIVEAAKCNACHISVGVAPNFHAGQRNDGPSCSWCHTQNRTSSGWSAGSESFVHAIHGGGKRSVPFNWHALDEDEGFFKVAFPAKPNLCMGCHQAGYFDFSNSWYTESNVDTRLVQTVATGTYNALPLPDGGVNSAAWSISPYVVADGGVSYGSGFSYNAGTQVTTEAAATTLVNSPISNVCFGCHDSARSALHYELNGGAIYEPRGPYPTQVGKTELCLICHGPGKVAAISDVHYK